MALQLPMFLPDAAWRPTPVNQLPSWGDAKRVCVDVETCDPQLKKLGIGVRRDGYVSGIAFAIEGGPSHYLPIRHAGGDNLPLDHVVSYMRDQAANFEGEIPGAKLPYDLDYLEEMGITFPKVAGFLDVQIAEPLIDELQFSYSLDAICGRRGIPGKRETLLRAAAEAYNINPKSDMWQLPARFVGEYAEGDVEVPLELIRLQEADLAQEDQGVVWKLESRLMPMLVGMTRRGVRIDLDRLEQINAEAWAESVELLAQVKRETGVQLSPEDVKKEKALRPIFDHLGLVVPQKDPRKDGRDPGDSVKNGWLDNLDHDVTTHLARVRRLYNLRHTFVAGIQKYLIGDRIHSSFRQVRSEKETGGGGDDTDGSRFGRMSAIDPNAQQQPTRVFPQWREIFVPDVGAQWGKADVSGQEVRIGIHFAELINAPRAKEIADRFRADPKTDMHQWTADLIGKDRPIAKNVYLGLCYGMGQVKFCKQYGFETQWIRNRQGAWIEVAAPEVKAMLDTFDREVPFVRALARKAERTADERGYIVTLLGARCRFPTNEHGHREWCWKAINRLIQKSAAMQMKKALVDVHDAGYKPQLAVHDEIDQSISRPAEIIGVAKVMCDAVTLRVPTVVDPEIGPNWGELEKIAA